MFSASAIIIFPLLVLLFSVIIHELAHGYIAFYLGDQTARYAGRLTLNPLKHLDLFGSIMLPLFLFIMQSPFLFGWAKPVPINPYNLRGRDGRLKYGELKVAIAGPISNLCLALVFGLLLRFVPVFQQNFIFKYIVLINIWLAIFNLIPVPPLDGSWILFNLLPAKLNWLAMLLRQYGILILLAVILFGGLFWSRLISTIFYIITGQMLTL